MGSTYTIVCDECKVKQEAGHSSMGNKTLYDVSGFLFNHAHHPIRMLLDSAWDEYEPAYDYKKVKEKGVE